MGGTKMQAAKAKAKATAEDAAAEKAPKMVSEEEEEVEEEEGSEEEDDADDDDGDEDEDEDEDEDDDDDDDAEPLQLDIDNFGRPHGVTGTLDYSFRSLHGALRVPDDKSYVELVQDCETAFTAREIENAEYSTGTTFFLPATMEPRCVLERMAREVFDFHTRDVKEYNADKSGAEWWTLVLDAGETNDDVAFHWDRDYGLEDQYHVNLHPHVGTVTYLSDIGGPTIVLDKVSPVQTGSDDCGAGEIATGYVSRPVLGKHISFDGRLLHGAPGDLATVFTGLTEESAPSSGEKRKLDSQAIQNGRRVTFLVNVWLNHKPIDSDPFPEENLAKLACPKKSGVKFVLEQAETTQKPEDEIQVVEAGKDEATTLELSFVEASRKMALTLPVPVKAMQDVVRKTPAASSFQVDFHKESLAVLVAGEEVEDEEDDDDDEDSGDDDDEEEDEE